MKKTQNNSLDDGHLTLLNIDFQRESPQNSKHRPKEIATHEAHCLSDSQGLQQVALEHLRRKGTYGRKILSIENGWQRDRPLGIRTYLERQLSPNHGWIWPHLTLAYIFYNLLPKDCLHPLDLSPYSLSSDLICSSKYLDVQRESTLTENGIDHCK